MHLDCDAVNLTYKEAMNSRVQIVVRGQSPHVTHGCRTVRREAREFHRKDEVDFAHGLMTGLKV